MDRPKRKLGSWQFKSFLLLAVAAGLGLFGFSRYVSTLSDDPVGNTPLSWSFKPIANKVATTFNAEQTMPVSSNKPLVRPEIDLRVPAETDFALFALG